MLMAVFSGGVGTVDQGVGTITSGVAKSAGTISASTTFTLTVTNAVGTSTAQTRVSVAMLSLFVGVPSGVGNVDGTGAAARFNAPCGVAVDRFDNVYVADPYNNTLRKITPAGVVNTLAGTAGIQGSNDGAGAAASFFRPHGVAVDGSGTIYVADTNNGIIRKVTPEGVVSTLAGTAQIFGHTDGTGAAASFFLPYGVVVDGFGNVYVTDYFYNNTIRKITPEGVVSTLAGMTGRQGSVDGTGVVARFHFPLGVTVDGSGNIYVADVYNQTIRKITPEGVVSTLAGMAGVQGSTDDTGAAASFFYPHGVAADGSGNIYVADSGNNTIRKITPAGLVSTLAGTAGIQGNADGTGTAASFSNPQGVAVDESGTVYIADTDNNTIRKITPEGIVSTLVGKTSRAGSTDGAGAIASFSNPQGVTVDGSGNVYVTDTDNHTIRKITPTGDVSTLVGKAGASGHVDSDDFTIAVFYAPNCVAVDGSGNVYVGSYNHRTIRIMKPGGLVSTLVGIAGSGLYSVDGTGGSAIFFGPDGLALDGSGNAYFTDGCAIRKITPGGVVSTLAGRPIIQGDADGNGTAAGFSYPCGLAVDDSGNIFVADTMNYTIRRITPTGLVSTLAGTAGIQGSNDGAGTAASFSYPLGIAVDGSENVYVVDGGDNSTIRKITPEGVVSTLAGTAGQISIPDMPELDDGPGAAARFNLPHGVTVDGSGNVYVADAGNHSIRRITPEGDVSTLAGLNGTPGIFDGVGVAARFDSPCDVTVDGSGNVYVADFWNATIRKVTPEGMVSTLAGIAGIQGHVDNDAPGPRFNAPCGVTVDGSGIVYVSDTWDHTIRKITPEGAVSTLAGMAGKVSGLDGLGAAASFERPGGVAVDGSGNVYVADTGNSTIRKITPAGVVSTFAGKARWSGSVGGADATAVFSNPQGVAVDGSGTIYVADTWNHTIRKITPEGVVNTLAGTAGAYGSTDGTGAAASFNGPCGLAMDGSGNIYVADSGNSTIRMITPGGVVSTVVGVAGRVANIPGPLPALISNPRAIAVDPTTGDLYIVVPDAILKVTF